nr:MAG TPA: hypothetical protein [Caudoviricetes sp.]
MVEAHNEADAGRCRGGGGCRIRLRLRMVGVRCSWYTMV